MWQQVAFWPNIKQEVGRLSSWEYFQPTIAIVTLIVFFFLGRKTYESKFSYILGIINDAQNEKRRLQTSLQKYNTSLRSIRSKLTFLRIATAVLIVLTAFYLYIYLSKNKIDFEYIIYISLTIVVFWTIVILRIQYLEMAIKRTETKLQRKTLSSESDSKQLMGLLGQELCSALKTKFERDLHLQTQQEQLRQCDLKRCYDEKKLLKEIYSINKIIISQMQQMSWCETCAQNLNIEANQLKIGQLQGRMKNYKSVAGGLSLEKKKQLTNRLLSEWESLEGKLSKICRRGCCIRFRLSVQEIKRKHHDKLMSIKSALNAVK